MHFDCASSRKPGRGDLSSEDLVLLARRPRFLSYVHFAWQAWRFPGILKSETLFGVTGGGHRTLFHPHSRRGTFLYVAQTERCYSSWHAQYLVNLDDILNRSKIL